MLPIFAYEERWVDAVGQALDLRADCLKETNLCVRIGRKHDWLELTVSVAPFVRRLL